MQCVRDSSLAPVNRDAILCISLSKASDRAFDDRAFIALAMASSKPNNPTGSDRSSISPVSVLEMNALAIHPSRECCTEMKGSITRRGKTFLDLPGGESLVFIIHPHFASDREVLRETSLASSPGFRSITWDKRSSILTSSQRSVTPSMTSLQMALKSSDVRSRLAQA